MHPSRKIGHNVLHLIYPIRVKQKNELIDQYFINNHDLWERIYDDPTQVAEQNLHEHNISFNFPSTYSVQPFTSDDPSEKSLRHWIDNKELYSYFHPSVQRILFQKNKKLKIFRKKDHQPRMFVGKFSRASGDEFLPAIPIEWISSEVYLFSEESGFLVARVSLLENVSVGDSFEYHDAPVHSFETWMKFLNRIRQNYQKHAAQPRMLVTENQEGDAPKLFFEYLQDSLTDDMNIFITGIDLDVAEEEPLPNIRQRLEANCYVHAFAQSNISQFPLTVDEKYQIVHVDDYDGESGGDKQFKEEFIKERIYSRWAPYTYYTAIDYGAVTIADCDSTCYQWQSPRYSFADLLYQHHTRHYLFFILLQLYYRDELQEIMGKYASLPNFEKQDRHVAKAKQILTSYYNLNQHFIFDRITHEIQGLEMWKFYQQVLGTRELYKSVQEDMKELNSRLIETSSDKSNTEIRKLTIIAAITGMLGMNIFIDKAGDFSILHFILGRAHAGELLSYSDVYAFILQMITLMIIVFIVARYVIYEMILYLQRKLYKKE